MNQNQLTSIAISGFSVLVGLAAALALAAALGENPWTVAEILLRGSFGSQTAIGYSLFYATPLIFTGLAVAWALRAGLFNIGAEGQMTMGGVAMAISGILLGGLPPWLALPIALMSGFLAGAFWGWMVAWLKVKRGTHEVLGSILLNFVSYGVAGFFILNVFRNPEAQSPETLSIGAGFTLLPLGGIGGTSPFNAVFFFGLALAGVYALVFRKTKFGLHQRWVGGAPEFAQRSGLRVEREAELAMAISGGIAGLAGASLILGYMYKAREGFAGGAGFIGIAVALLGRGGALGVVLAAILFGALQKGSLDLDLDTDKISRDLAVVIQALIVLAIAARPALETQGQRLVHRLLRTKRKH